MKLTILFIALILSSKLFAANSKKSYSLYTYHYKTPFLVDKTTNEGFSNDLISLLNKYSKNYNFKLVVRPRNEIESTFKTNPKSVLWVNPVWFKDKKKTKFLWTTPLLRDKDVFVSKKKFEYSGLDSLKGKELILPRGFYFYGVSEMIDKGEIKPFYVLSELQSLKMIIQDRGDTAIISNSMLNNLLETKLKMSRSILRISKMPHDEFDRMILVPKSDEVVFKEIQNLLKAIKQSNEWDSLLKKYHFK